ncbi:hypothetical protein [Streptomyces sp. B21-083]|uniref:hypothetical protein n=1 Tax=Streptomyces sp. B21-083 TaxID=3039410 RepID=UPI002FEFD5B4
MDRQHILDLYEWRPAICFRHPGRGVIDTTVVKTIHPRDDDDREVRACQECVMAMEDMQREAAARSGSDYEPGRVGEASP